MSLTICGFNVVLKMESLDRVINGGSASFIKRVREPRHCAASVASDDHLVAVRFSEPFFLEILVKNLIHYGFHMSKGGMFADFAIVHAQHGLTMPCDWLESECADKKRIVWMKGKARDPSCFVFTDEDMEPLDSEVLSDSPGWIGSDWLTQVGHGFLLTRESGYNVWLDFNTGRLIVNGLPDVANAQ
ncbi:MAG: hypothetical protein ABI681_11145 [Gemmatimonadales bacterium]